MCDQRIALWLDSLDDIYARDAPSQQFGSLALTSSASLSVGDGDGKTRPAKRRRPNNPSDDGNDQGVVSHIDSTSNLLASRPESIHSQDIWSIWNPKAVARNLRLSQPSIILQTPAFNIRWCSSNRQTSRPSVVDTIKGFAACSKETVVLPLGWKTRLDDASPFQTLAYDEHESFVSEELDCMLRHLESVLEMASQGHIESEDEPSWRDIALAILKGPDSEHLDGIPENIEVIATGLKTFEPALAPKSRYDDPSHALPACRIDFALGYHKDSPNFRDFFREVQVSRPSVQLSPIVDDSNCDSILGCVVEVKWANGAYLEGLMELAMTSFATIERLCLNIADQVVSSSDTTNETVPIPAVVDSWLEDQLPFPSISVIGNDWDLHWMYWDSTDVIDRFD
ncbi:hypothetical protein TWF281_002636 [Arthrobotrys megalospora]